MRGNFMQVTQSSEVMHRLNGSWRDYLSLTKPQDILLILLTTLTAMLIAGSHIPSISTLVFTMIGSALAAAGAGVINCYLDRDIDAVMSRTRNRPLPAEHIEPRQALRFGIALSVSSFFVLWLGANLLAALLSLVGLFIYNGLYTYWLKRRTMHNIFLAGASWAFPPLVGWAAATGTLSITALSLFAIIFYWTPVNFWALGITRLSDFNRAGIPILPVIKGSLTARRLIVLFSMLTLFVSLLPAAIGMMNFIYAEAALLLGGVLIFQAVELFRHPSISEAARVNRFSIIYLALLFSAMLLDKTILFH